MQDWKKRHHHSGAGLLDLVLDGSKDDPGLLSDRSLQDAIRSRFMQDTIRQVHLRSNDSGTLASIILSLTPDNKGSWNQNIESIVWQALGDQTIDVSEFFTRSRLLKLHILDLAGTFQISSWDSLTSGITLLTTLSLGISPTLTTSQLFQIATSNPSLRELTLSDMALPNDAEGLVFQVPLPNLELLSLSGDFCHLFGLLYQLVLPERLDNIRLVGLDPTVEDISQTLAPYMQEYFQRDPRFQGRLGISPVSGPAAARIWVDVAGGPPFVEVLVILASGLPPASKSQILSDLIALTPQRQIVSFNACLGMRPPEGVLSAMPNIERLTLSGVGLTEGFLQPNPDGPYTSTKLLPSLQSLHLMGADLADGDWGHLITYLAHQTSGGQLISLEVSNSPHMPPEVVNRINGLVERFTCCQKLKAGGRGLYLTTPGEDE